MSWYTYILRCENGNLYTGVTNDLARRFDKHSGKIPGGAKYTRANRPVRFECAFVSREKGSALRLEATIKKLPRRKKLELIERNIPGIIDENIYERADLSEQTERRAAMNFDVIKANLEAKGYKVTCFETAVQAADYLCGEIKNTSVAFGGSVTAQEMGLYEKLGENNKVIWHWKVPEGKTMRDMRDKARNAKIYISSVNGIAETGEIINIDGTGNRLAETMYGHEKVYLVIGCNKIAPDFEKAMFRARNVAAPLNAQRLKRKTPCAEKGDRCYDCKSPDRICNAFSIFAVKPGGNDYEIILINEKLGY